MKKHIPQPIDINRLPFRQGVGMMIVNKDKKVFVGKRIDTKNDLWQMPQGGIDIGETPSKAVLREMKEEIGCNEGSIMQESKFWYKYDLPKFLIPRLWNGKYRGQRQKWFLIKFEREDECINISTGCPEFAEWKWINFEDVPGVVVPFKKKLYEAICLEFQDYFSS
jgi:putative (di)nucleoside polyphosphate hydrolase